MTLGIQDATTQVTTATTDTTTAPPDWRSGLPQDLQADKSLAQIKDVASLARSYVDTKKMVGDSIRLPKADAKPEERQKFLEDIWGKLGRPVKAEEYGIGEPEGLPDGMPWDMGVQGAFLTEAHKLGLTKEQAEGVLSWYAGASAQAFEAGRKTLDEAKTTLRGTWAGQTDRNMEIAKRTAALFGTKFQKLLTESGAGNDPDLIKGFYAVGKNLMEAGLISGEVQGGPSEQEIRGRIKAMREDPKHPYNNPGHPRHEEAREEYFGLWKLLHPQES